MSKLNDDKAYSALVRSLELSLKDVKGPVLSDRYWDEYYLRDMAERFCLMFILELVNKYNAKALVKAKFIDKWLVKQEWGTELEERQQNFHDYVYYKHNRIVDIIHRIKQSRRGVKALEKAGLMNKESVRRRLRELPDIIAESEGETVDTPSEEEEQQVPRAREHSAEEQRLRRLHREAMVLNDGTRPLGRDDIIERDHGSPT